MTAHVPEGAYFLFPDIRELGMTSIEATRFFLDEAHVMTVPGSSFGPNGEGHVRLLFSCTEDEARKAAARIRDAVSRL
jgi:aminotransferase